MACEISCTDGGERGLLHCLLLYFIHCVLCVYIIYVLLFYWLLLFYTKFECARVSACLECLFSHM